MKNLKFKFLLIELFGSQFNAVRELGPEYSESKISKWISGRQFPTDEEIKFLCKKLKVTEKDLGFSNSGGRNV